MAPSPEERYSRQILLREWGPAGQRRVADSEFVVLGAGGVGSPACLALAAAGAGSITVIDSDLVEEVDLARQILHHPDRVGQPKAESARHTLLQLNPAVRVRAIGRRVDAEALLPLLGPASFLLDCSDNFRTRHACNRAAYAARRPLISASAVRFSYQVAVFDFRRADTPCYACLFPEDDEPDLKASQVGVLGAVTGVAGMLAAGEALRLAAGLPAAAGRLLLGDTLTARFETLQAAPRPGCPVCGGHRG